MKNQELNEIMDRVKIEVAALIKGHRNDIILGAKREYRIIVDEDGEVWEQKRKCGSRLIPKTEWIGRSICAWSLKCDASHRVGDYLRHIDMNMSDVKAEAKKEGISVEKWLCENVHIEDEGWDDWMDWDDNYNEVREMIRDYLEENEGN